MSKGSFVANVQRRQWDLSEYEAKAAEKKRLEEEEASLKDAKNRNRARAQSALVVRAPLQHRAVAVQLESRLGKHTIVTNSTPLSQRGGYYCDVCECLLKDSNSYLDHINGKKHQRALGMTLRAERSSLGEVRAKLDEHKRSAAESSESASSELERRLHRFSAEVSRESDERKAEKAASKAQRKEAEKRAREAEDQFDLGRTTSESRKRKSKGSADVEVDDDDDGEGEDADRPTKKSKAEPAAAEPEEEDPEAAMMRAMGFATGFAKGKNAK
jgi:U4/U6.U5 tri-snRNP component SNU23